MDRRKNITATTSTSPSRNSRRFTIEQNVPNLKASTIVRKALDPNEVVIQRRFGEGSKPLFSRTAEVRNKTEQGNNPTTSGKKQNEKSASQKFNYKNSGKGEKPCTSKTETTEEKIPYFSDPKREADRLRQKAKAKHEWRKSSRSRSRSKSPRITTRSKHRRRSYSQSPSRESRSKRRSRRSRSGSYSKRGRSAYNRYRSSSRDRHRHRSRSRDSSRSRSRRKSPEKQYIPIPVPVEYPVAGWFAPGMHPYARHPYILRPPIPPIPPIHPMPPMFTYRPQFPPARFQGGYNNVRHQGKTGRPFFGSNYPR